MRRLPALALLIAMGALLVAGCEGLPPPKPTAAFRPEIVGLVKTVADLGCGQARVTLSDSRTLDLATVGADHLDPATYPGASATPARVAFGEGSSLDVPTLFVLGHDEAGTPWYGWARTGHNCQTGFAVDGGAFEEGSIFHLPSGFVLDKSPTYTTPEFLVSPMVVPTDGFVCLDRRGVVVSIFVPMRA